MKKNKFGIIMVWACIALIGSLIVIVIVDRLFSIPGNSLTAMTKIQAGDVLSYLGGVLSCIATIVLSYLVYGIEKTANQRENEKSCPCLTVEAFNEDYPENRYMNVTLAHDISNFPKDTSESFYVASPEKGTFLPAIVIPDISKNDVSCKMKQYIMEFLYTGDIRCKEISIGDIFLYDKHQQLVWHGSTNFKHRGILTNGDTLTVYLYYVSDNIQKIENGIIRFSYKYITLTGESGEYEIEIKKQEIPLAINQGEFQRNGVAEVLKEIKYLKEPRIK